MNRVLPLAALAAVGLFEIARRQATQRAHESAQSADGDGTTALDWVDPFGGIERSIDRYQTDQAMHDFNMQAFLSLIEYSEGTAQGGRDPYRTCYGYRFTISDFSDHPAVMGVWKGESLASLGPAYVGKVSTAAGRYQIIKPTWLECKRVLALPDFSPASQDAAAVYLIKRRGALDDVRAGRIEAALAKCSSEWASLPGAGYGQPERKRETLIAVYQGAGGVLA
jgi:muramidase (phage lysozyme)